MWIARTERTWSQIAPGAEEKRRASRWTLTDKRTESYLNRETCFSTRLYWLYWDVGNERRFWKLALYFSSFRPRIRYFMQHRQLLIELLGNTERRLDRSGWMSAWGVTRTDVFLICRHLYETAHHTRSLSALILVSCWVLEAVSLIQWIWMAFNQSNSKMMVLRAMPSFPHS